MAKRYSKEFKIKVVNELLEGSISIKGIAKKYDISSDSVVHRWLNGYKEQGYAYFDEEHRGRPHKVQPVNLDDMTLEEQVEYLKMENAILKKLKALMDAK